MSACKRCKSTPSSPALGPDEDLDSDLEVLLDPASSMTLKKETSVSGSEHLSSVPSSNASPGVLQGIDSKLFLVLPT